MENLTNTSAVFRAHSLTQQSQQRGALYLQELDEALGNTRYLNTDSAWCSVREKTQQVPSDTSILKSSLLQVGDALTSNNLGSPRNNAYSYGAPHCTFMNATHATEIECTQLGERLVWHTTVNFVHKPMRKRPVKTLLFEYESET